MHQVAVNLQQYGMCMALPALHAFSGCDSTSAFFGMGKRRWFDTAATHPELIEGFKGLGNNSSQIDPSTEASYLSLVMLMYSRKPHTSLTELRYSLFAIEQKRQWKAPSYNRCFPATLTTCKLPGIHLDICNRSEYLDISPISLTMGACWTKTSTLSPR